MAENMEQELDCELINIIVKVPKDTVSCSVTAKMLVNGKLEDAHMEMTPEEFRQARQDFLDEVEAGDDYDSVYALTEEGKAYVEKLLGREE